MRVSISLPRAMRLGRVEQETGPGLAASAMRVVVMRAHAHVVQLQIPLQQTIDFRYLFGQDGTPRDVRLIGDQYQSESGFVQFPASLAHSGQRLHAVTGVIARSLQYVTEPGTARQTFGTIGLVLRR